MMEYIPTSKSLIWDHLVKGTDVIAVFITEDRFYKAGVDHLNIWQVCSINKLLSRIANGSTKKRNILCAKRGGKLR